MSIPTAFPTHSPNLPRTVILTLRTTDGVILVRLHTTGNNLHTFTSFINREVFDTQFLWINIQPNRDTGDFDLDHQTVTIPADSNKAFSNIQQSTSHFPRHPTNDTREHEDNETENPPAPPYEPSPAHSPDYYTPTIQPATEPVTPAMDEDCEKLATMKKQKSPGQQTITAAAKDTGVRLTVLTEVQKLCLKQFEAHHKAWNAHNK
jgi:hypothetical protein